MIEASIVESGRLLMMANDHGTKEIVSEGMEACQVQHSSWKAINERPGQTRNPFL